MPKNTTQWPQSVLEPGRERTNHVAIPRSVKSGIKSKFAEMYPSDVYTNNSLKNKQKKQIYDNLTLKNEILTSSLSRNEVFFGKLKRKRKSIEVLLRKHVVIIHYLQTI